MKLTELLQSIPLPEQVWEKLTMDFIGGLPKANGKDTVLELVDRLTKATKCMPLCHPYTVKEVTYVFIRKVVCFHVFPSPILSDRDNIFISFFPKRSYSKW